MKLYKLTQNVNNGYETYPAIIVCAKNPEDAKRISPSSTDIDDYNEYSHNWADIKDIQCEYIGKAAAHIQRGVVLADYTGS